jgi:putative glutamine amidotransferase
LALPLIAVAPYRLAPGRVSGWTDSSEAVPSQYLDALRRAGSVPIALGRPDPAGHAVADLTAGGPGTPVPVDRSGVADPEPAALTPLLDPFAGLVLLGGGDVDPSRYGEVRGKDVYGTDPARDGYEMALVRAALGAGLPVLGICRGAQLLNVAFGGTLWQHLGDLDLPVAHGTPEGVIVPVAHDVAVVAQSRLSGLVAGSARVAGCVSIHHQSVRRVADGWRAVAWSDDGQIEALETEPDGPWCVAVQWHPERSAATDPVQQGLFDGFVAQARTASAGARR